MAPTILEDFGAAMLPVNVLLMLGAYSLFFYNMLIKTNELQLNLFKPSRNKIHLNTFTSTHPWGSPLCVRPLDSALLFYLPINATPLGPRIAPPPPPCSSLSFIYVTCQGPIAIALP